MKIEKWLREHKVDLKGKNVLFVGWTGSIGFEALKVLAGWNATLFLAARNLEKANKKIEELKKECPNVTTYTYPLDLSSLASVDSFVDALKKDNLHFDVFINNAGVFHLNPRTTTDGYDETFEVNTLSHIYLLKKIIPLLNLNARVISTSSMSYKFYKGNLSNIALENISNKMKKYALSKQEMLNAFMFMKENTERKDIEMVLMHPGIVPTELFEKGYSKFFMAIIFPIMKVLFHSPRKAMLGILLALREEVSSNEWIAPRGLLEAWGYPKKAKIKKSVLLLNEKVHSYINSLIRE